MPDLNPDVPIPANYPGSRRPTRSPKPPVITGGIKTSTGSLAKSTELWANDHGTKFGDPLLLLPGPTNFIVVGHTKRVSVPVVNLSYARPTMLHKSTAAVVWKQQVGDEVKTWCLALTHPTRVYTIDDADALAELMQRGLISEYRIGTVLIRYEGWYDNADDLPDYASVPVVNWPLEVSTRDGRIAALKKALAVGKSQPQEEQPAQVASAGAVAASAEIHRQWRAVLRDTHAMYIIIVVVIVIACLLLPTCHPLPWLAR
jgi:hypothetical protein